MKLCRYNYDYFEVDAKQSSSIFSDKMVIILEQ